MTDSRRHETSSNNNQEDIAKILQNKITNSMIEFGYKITPHGFCYGYATMAMQAMLAEKLDEHKQLIELIAKTNDLVSKIKSAQNLMMTAGKNTLEQTQEAIQFINILALFDGIAINQSPTNYLDWFDKKITFELQDFTKSASLTMPKQLEKFPLNPDENISFKSHNGIYSYDELLQYFARLQEILDTAFTSATPPDKSFVLSICSHFHQISVMYDFKIKKWIYADSARLPIREFSNTAELTSAVAHAMLPLKTDEKFDIEHTLFGIYSHTCSLSDANQASQNCLSAWLQSDEVTNGNKIGHKKELMALTFNSSSQEMINNLQQPLLIAVRFNNIKAVNLLIDMGASLQAYCNDHECAIKVAVNNDHTEILDFLLKNSANPEFQFGEDQITPLMLAVAKEQVVCTKQLLEYKANVDVTNKNGSTALIISAFKGNHEILKILLDNNANPNIADNDGATPVFVAAQEGHADYVKMLLKHHANPNLIFTSSAASLRSFAANSNVVESMELFIKKKLANGMSENAIQMTPYDISIVMGHKEISEILQYSEKKSDAKPIIGFFQHPSINNSNNDIDMQEATPPDNKRIPVSN